MKRVFLSALVFFSVVSLFAQEVGQINPGDIGAGAPNPGLELKEISVEKFEIEGFWSSHISSDNGYTTTRLFTGAPAGKEPMEDEEQLQIAEKYVLGTRVDFIHRGHTSIYFRPQQPISIEGITKTVSLWVVGRNFRHELYLLGKDFLGRDFELYVGRLDFTGWKQLRVAIPPPTDDGKNGIVQRDNHYFSRMGIMITGLVIKVDPWETFGSYYVYFDDMRAVTDLFTENNRDPDDMPDSW
ncbi:MAG: flagellar filament outer layer protein FlaA [Treponema sp.]|jgi:hypothetical protein|nr:flagellar filament outer layer protein FlaA [Treponema sp.]